MGKVGAGRSRVSLAAALGWVLWRSDGVVSWVGISGPKLPLSEMLL